MEKKTIGTFIAALRKANGMTQQELANRLNVSNKAVSRWERDECAPDLTLIPALAEIFGVTCDELLKGERIFIEHNQEKTEPKVEKQLKALINRSISSFKTLLWISLALSVVGLVCMFSISYGFYRPIIGFAVMILFEAAAFVLAIIGVNKMKEAKKENELFDNADSSLISNYNRVLGNFSYIAYFAIVSVISLSLPFLFFLSDYINSVLTFESYFKFFNIITLALVLVFFAPKDIYCAWITEQPYSQTIKNKNPKIRTMNALQLVAVAFASILYVLYPYFESPNVGWITDVFYLGALLFNFANIVFFIVYLLKFKADRKDLILPGIRNILLIIPTIFVQHSHYVSFGYIGESISGSTAGLENIKYERYDTWNVEYIWFALGLALSIFVIFKLIETIKSKKLK